MSYDFRLCLPQAGRSREETVQAEGEESATAAADPVAELVKERVAAALTAHDPGLERSRCDFDETARPEEITAEEAKRSSRHIEFNTPADGPGIQIQLFDREASVTVPYWHTRKTAAAVFDKAFGYLRIMVRTGGYFVFDPQLGRVLDLQKDLPECAAAYTGATSRVASAMGDRSRAGFARTIFPATLGRGGYFMRWCALSLVAGLVFVGCAKATRGTAWEPVVFLPLVAWFVVKILVLDTARLRGIGWSTRLTFLSLFPPAAALLQLALFLVE